MENHIIANKTKPPETFIVHLILYTYIGITYYMLIYRWRLIAALSEVQSFKKIHLRN